MSDDHRKPKRYKNILSWFSSDSSSTRRSGNESGSGSGSGSGSRNVTENDGNDILVNPSPSIPHEDCQNERVEIEQETDINSLERDPGKRLSIWKYPLNERDNVRRAYVVLGPFQPELSEYPYSFDGSQNRRFNCKWFKDWPWLEYSIEVDKAFCFPCFLFDSNPSHHPAFTEDGFRGWKKWKICVAKDMMVLATCGLKGCMIFGNSFQL
ncbi:hypothetical protein M0R45_009526 [Rubus argutus]|uniref:TTF-type domain-containing protein n=1 Tax=Rubus argutus TaxID=59490 RepID=A0AAW1Y864_RUBAR